MGTQRKTIALLYGGLCHGLFATAVGVMIYEMFFGMSRSWGVLRNPWNWVFNGVLLLQFPIVHSLLLSRAGRSVLARLAPACFATTLSTTTYVIVASMQIFLLFGLWSPSGTIWWQARSPLLPVMAVLYATGWLLLVKSMFDAGITLQTGSLGWWAVLKDKPPAYPGLPTRGLFRVVRQPIYLSFAITLWTVPIWTPDQLFLASALTAYCLIGPLFKEARFRRLFGSEFEAYRARHPYWLPWPRPTRQPRLLNDLSIYEQYGDRWWDGSERWLRTLQNLVPARLAYFDRCTEWPGLSVLDLGCGGGFMAEALASRGARVTGIDPSPAAIGIAAQHAQLQQMPIHYLVGWGEDLPLLNDELDCVICTDVLEHVGDLDRVLDEIQRVLRPGGLFLFDTINRTPLASFVIIVWGEMLLRLLPRGTHDPRKFIRPAELRMKLRRRGFDDCVFAGLGPRGVNRKFDVTFGRLPGTAIMYMGHARRALKAAVAPGRG